MLNANHDAADTNQHELHCSRKIRNPDVNIFLIFVFQSSFALGIFIAIAIEGRGGGCSGGKGRNLVGLIIRKSGSDYR